MVNNLQSVSTMGYFIVGKMNEVQPDIISRIKKYYKSSKISKVKQYFLVYDI